MPRTRQRMVESFQAELEKAISSTMVAKQVSMVRHQKWKNWALEVGDAPPKVSTVAKWQWPPSGQVMVE